jgi:hypothetical protein
MFVTLFAILLAERNVFEGIRRRQTVEILLLVAGMATVHFLSALATLGVLVGLQMIRMKYGRLLLLGVTTVFVAWTVFWAWPMLSSRLGWVVVRIFDVSRLVREGLVERIVAGSGDQHFANLARVTLSSMFIIAAGIGVMRSMIQRDMDKDATAMLSAVGAIGLLTVIIGAAYGHELFQRMFVFALPFLGYFVGRLVAGTSTYRAILVASAMAFMLPLHLIAHYGNERVDYMSNAQVYGLRFFHSRTDGGRVLTVAPYGLYTNPEAYTVTMLESVYDKPTFVPEFQRKDLRDYLSSNALGQMCYVQIGVLEHRWMAYRYNDAEFVKRLVQTVEDSSNEIYANGDLSLYVCGVAPASDLRS